MIIENISDIWGYRKNKHKSMEKDIFCKTQTKRKLVWLYCTIENFDA